MYAEDYSALVEIAAQVAAAEQHLKLAKKAMKGLSNRIETPPQQGSKATRTTRQKGRRSLIDTDQELNAFVRERINRLTYKQLADEIAEAFPADRRVSLSSIHRWWQRNHSG